MDCPCRRFFSSFSSFSSAYLTTAFRPHRLVSRSRLQHQGCTKQLFKVGVAWPFARARRLPSVTPSALETHAFPTPALQNQQLTLRKAGSFVLSSTSGQ